MQDPPLPSDGSIVPLRADPLNKSPLLPTSSTAPLLTGSVVGAMVGEGARAPGVLVGRVVLAAASVLVGAAAVAPAVGGSVGGGVPVGVNAIAVCVPAESVALASVRANAISVARLIASEVWAVKTAVSSAATVWRM